jgi:anaerobic magnesium-protoporphyrin IX monomethyl ester cyclase
LLSILVAHSYFLRLDDKQRRRAKPYPPLATLQVAALLRDAKHRVALFDAMLAEGIDDYDRALAAARPKLVVCYEDNYNFLSKMCLGTMRRACCDMIARAKRVGARVIAAGSDASDAPGEYLKAGADVVLRGEGLSALLALVCRLDADAAMPVRQLVAGIPGVAATDAGAASGPAVPHSAPQLPRRLAWDLVDVERYRSVWRMAHGYFSLNMAASRGCSFRCNWCAKPIWGQQYLQRPPAETAEEMLHLKREYAPDHIWFADDIFGFRADWVSAFAAALDAGGGGVPFTIQLRADLVSARMASALRAAGCREVWIGAESGSQKILDAMNKGTRVAEVVAARSSLGAEGIRVGFFLQLGYPGEELADILATRDLVQHALPDDVGVSVAYPLPGTKFYELVKAQLGAKTNWQDSGDLDMMFCGTYRSEFYRTVRDLLHEEVTAGAGSLALRQRWNDLAKREAHFRTQPEELVPLTLGGLA